MANVEQYRQYIQQLLTQRAQTGGDDVVEAQTIFDTERNHYQLVYVGWENRRRVYGCVIHVDIKDGKIWIQHDGTEIGIADDLVALGVPKQDIVLAFQAPNLRKFTEFAVG